MTTYRYKKGEHYNDVDENELRAEIAKKLGFDGWKLTVRKTTISITSKDFGSEIDKIFKEHVSPSGILRRAKAKKEAELNLFEDKKIHEKYSRDEEFKLHVIGWKDPSNKDYIKYTSDIESIRSKTGMIRLKIHGAESLEELEAIDFNEIV